MIADGSIGPGREGPPVAGLPGLLDELRWRGLLHAYSKGLPVRLATGRPIKAYNGFDPSGPSLHAGSLVPVFGLIHLQRRGGTPVVVVGGGTGMIGDPSGRSSERNLLDVETLRANQAAIQAQLEHFLDFSGSNAAIVVNNYDWLSRYSLLDFLREIGKHLTVPYMLGKDSVQLRLGSGLSFTEFSYMLLQAADFLHLYREMGVELQAGGADQWGNITAGLELIRRVSGGGESSETEGNDLAYALSYPLLLNDSGAKFGKTAAGTSVWLDPVRTPPFEFYQYWLNADDRDVGQYLRQFTLFDQETVADIQDRQAAAPETRVAQKAVAFDLTERVHGRAAAEQARRVSEALFAREIDPALVPAMAQAIGAESAGEAETPVALGVASGTYASNGEARRAVRQGGLSINGVRVTDPDGPLPEPIAGEYYLLRAGKKRVVIARRPR